MSGITFKQVDKLVDITLQDFPWPSVTDMLDCFSVESKEDAKACAEFISKHYTSNEILAGFEEYLKHLELCFKLFGAENE